MEIYGSMRKAELAMLYGPGLTPGGALLRLNRWIRQNPQLLSELAETGYHSKLQVLTARQVELIVKHLGEP